MSDLRVRLALGLSPIRPLLVLVRGFTATSMTNLVIDLAEERLGWRNVTRLGVELALKNAGAWS